MAVTFLNNNNLQLIWELLVEEALIQHKRPELQINILNVFNNNVNSFYESEKNKTDGLMSMNKKYIISMITYINTIECDETLKKNTITNSMKNTNDRKYKNAPDLVTIEEVHNDRKVKFEQDLNRHQSDFANAITQNVPNVPDFKIKLEEEPIKEMEKKIKEMTAQRNYDIEQINKGNNIRASGANNTWLDNKMGQSIKSEAINKTTQDNITNPGTKYIKIDNNDIDLSDAKLNAINLSFYANDLIEPNEGDIFKKFKKTQDPSNELINTQCLITTLDAKVTSLSEELKTVNEKLDKLCNILLKNEMK